jgi:hypothetical protein
MQSRSCNLSICRDGIYDLIASKTTASSRCQKSDEETLLASLVYLLLYSKEKGTTQRLQYLENQ